MKTNIILTGFMGTGKTSVGRLLAGRLDRLFVDMDDEIVAHFGKPIPKVFAEEGEPAFRAVEAAICRKLAAQQGLIIATGGGALVNPENRAAMEATGVVVCLTATPDAILERVGGDTNRPLLAGELSERRARIAALLETRAAAYNAIHRQVDTTGLAPTAVADRVLALIAEQ